MATPTLLDRMRQDMQLRGLAARTQKCYLDVVGSVATFCGRPPNALDTLTEDELRQYFLHLVRDRQASRSTLLVHRSGGSASWWRPRSARRGLCSTWCDRRSVAPSRSS